MQTTIFIRLLQPNVSQLAHLHCIMHTRPIIPAYHAHHLVYSAFLETLTKIARPALRRFTFISKIAHTLVANVFRTVLFMGNQIYAF